MYFYRVRAVNVAGKGDWSGASADAGETLPAAQGTPGLPAGPTATADAEGTVMFMWGETSPGTLPITGFEVQYQRDDDNTDSDWSDATLVQINTPTKTNFVQKNVPGGATVVWEYRVRAVNGNGPGAWTEPDDATGDDTGGRVAVPARAPAAPELTATQIGPTEIRLEWTIPQSNGTMIDGFDIRQWDR